MLPATSGKGGGTPLLWPLSQRSDMTQVRLLVECSHQHHLHSETTMERRFSSILQISNININLISYQTTKHSLHDQTEKLLEQ